MTIQLKKIRSRVRLWLCQNRTLDWYLSYHNAPPVNVSLETSTWCNRRCSYCPLSKSDRGLKVNEVQMSEETYLKILNDLKEMGFAGKFAFQFYNEPLLDKRLPDFLRLARKILGEKVNLTFSTNGDLLNVEKLRELHEIGVRRITVSIHDAKMRPQLRKMLEEIEKHNLPCPELNLKGLKDFKNFHNRGGLVNIMDEVDANKDRYKDGCEKATRMQLDAKGNVVLCCNDFNSAYELGNVKGERLSSIWLKSRELRRRIYTGQYELDICLKCVGRTGEGVKAKDFRLG